MKILYLSHHWTNNSHHSKYGGFQRLVVEAAKSNQVTLVTWGEKSASHVDENGIRVIIIKGAERDFLFSKRIAISRMGRRISKEFDVVHALYSDCTFHLPKNGFIVTFHVLPQIAVYREWKQKIFIALKYQLLQKRAMKRAEQIVCVSRNLVEKMQNQRKDKVRFIPHGIDTDFWDPRPCSGSVNPYRQPYILCVGSHGLDEGLLKEFALANPSLEFILVGIRAQMESCNNIRYLYNTPDEELRALYFHAEAIIKPLLFATANNSVLEALAMGKTIIVSRIPGITDYLNDSTCIFIDTLKSKSLAKEALDRKDSSLIREYATKNFSWKVILNQYVDCYTKNAQPLSNG
jgi:glycosyltransferase involved in cell wall biosynthesis